MAVIKGFIPFLMVDHWQLWDSYPSSLPVPYVGNYIRRSVNHSSFGTSGKFKSYKPPAYAKELFPSPTTFPVWKPNLFFRPHSCFTSGGLDPFSCNTLFALYVQAINFISYPLGSMCHCSQHPYKFLGEGLPSIQPEILGTQIK